MGQGTYVKGNVFSVEPISNREHFVELFNGQEKHCKIISRQIS
jgi:hypothetical protein